MALVDYSLERFPEELADQIETIDGINELVFGEFDIQAEDQAHRTNLMIAKWIQRLATSALGSQSHFIPDHTYVGMHHVDLADDIQTEKFEVGFFSLSHPAGWLVAPTPFLTLYFWRVKQLGFGVIWTSLGFRCEEITPEAEEAIYQQVLASATKGFDTAS